MKTYQSRSALKTSAGQRSHMDSRHSTLALTHAQGRANRTRLPHRLKAGIESLSGFAMDDVRVHYNSANFARLVQQKQGWVKPTLQMKGVTINDDGALARGERRRGAPISKALGAVAGRTTVIQRAAATTSNLKEDSSDDWADFGTKPAGVGRMVTGHAGNTLVTSDLASCVCVVAWHPTRREAVMAHQVALAEEHFGELKKILLGKFGQSERSQVTYHVGLGTIWIEKNKTGKSEENFLEELKQLQSSIQKIFGVTPIASAKTMRFDVSTGSLSVVKDDEEKRLLAEWHEDSGEKIYPHI